MIITANGELIRRYEDKTIIDINSEKHEVMSTCDSTGFNDLLTTMLPRLSTTINKLVTRINNVDDQMYNKTLLEISDNFIYGEHFYPTTITEPLKSLKTLCEGQALGARIPIPEPLEFTKFAESMLKIGIAGQMMPTIETNTDIVLAGPGTTIDDDRGTELKNKQHEGITLMKAGTFSTTKAPTDDDSLSTPIRQICLLPKKLEKITKFHRELLNKNGKRFVKILRQLKEQINNYNAAGVSTKNMITTLKTELPIPKPIFHLYKCINPYDLTNIIFDPENHCIEKMRSAAQHMKDINSLLYGKKNFIRSNFEEYGVQKLNNHTIILTTRTPKVINGHVYEVFQEGGGPLEIKNSHILYEGIKLCYIITERPEIVDDKLLLRAYKPLKPTCCYALMNNNHTRDCAEEREYGNEYQISPYAMMWAFYINITLTITTLFTIIMTSCKIMIKKWKMTDRYRLQKIRRNEKKEKEKREIEMAEISRKNSTKNKPPKVDEDSDSDYQIELISAVKKKKSSANANKDKKRAIEYHPRPSAPARDIYYH